MSYLNYTQGTPTPGGYGLGLRQPTGMGLPGYDPECFGVRPVLTLTDVEWCDEAGCPKAECVGCHA